MAYATTADFAELGLPGQATADWPGTSVEAALDAASARVDSYLRKRYGVPIPAPGADLVETTCALAAWTVLCTRGFDPMRPGDQSVRQRYEDAVAWLEAVAAGKVEPVDAADDATPATDEGAPTVESDEERGWGVPVLGDEDL
ncbi:MAG: DUF1320 family protein [Polyangiaceae bacterium]|nr:DUF1320 family protein [Polyangiaceae bacterium]